MLFVSLFLINVSMALELGSSFEFINFRFESDFPRGALERRWGPGRSILVFDFPILLCSAVCAIFNGYVLAACRRRSGLPDMTKRVDFDKWIDWAMMRSTFCSYDVRLIWLQDAFRLEDYCEMAASGRS